MTTYAEPVAAKPPVVIDLSKPMAHNLPAGAFTCSPKGFTFQCRQQKPADAPAYFVRFAFTVPEAGAYEFVLAGRGSGAFRQSRYAWALDDGKPQPARCTRRVWPQDKPPAVDGNRQPAVTLTAGAHTLELRFAPEDGKLAMNRVREKFEMHNVEVTAAWAVPGNGMQPAKAPVAAPGQAEGLLLGDGDRVVLLGDSITDEAFFAKHMVRLLAAAAPGKSIEIYNAGVTLNRTWEAVERLERDVLALKPSWCFVALGTNDCVHMSPAVFALNYDMIIGGLAKAGVRPVCVSIPGMIPEPDPDGSWFHTADRAAGFDRTCMYEARFAAESAKRVGCPFADAYGAFTRSGIPRKSLMANQWHPNDEGGRMYALALLRTVGLTRADVQKSGDATDLKYFDALAGMAPFIYPSFTGTAMSSAGNAGADAAGTDLLAVSCFSRNTVEFFDVASGQFRASVEVGHHPMAPAYDAATKRLYVPCEGSGTIEVIELPACRKIEPIALGDVYPDGVALAADGKTAWTANFFGSSLMEIELPSGTVRRTVSLGSLAEGITRQNDALLVGTRNGLRVWRPGEAEAAPAVKVAPYAATFCSPDGQRLCAVDTATWQWFDLKLDGKALTAGAGVAAPVKARAVVRSPQTGDLFAGDCAAGQVLRLPKGQGPAVPFATVEFPMGLAICPVK